MGGNFKSLVAKIAYSPLGNFFVQLVGGARLYAELKVRVSLRRNLAIAEKEFMKETAVGSFNDYKDALYKHWVTYNEYAYQYEFYNKTEKERGEYISRLRMAYFYWRYTPGGAKSVFRDKTKFLKAFRNNVHRKWLYAPDSSFKDFELLVSNHDCIVKPHDGKLGKGVYKVYKNTYNRGDRRFFESLVKDRVLVEECIESCDELKAFHPQSLNTIRVVTIANRDKACVFSGVFRTGVGDSVVDNSHKGGISVQIDVNSGIIETDGANTNGERFVEHPDTGITFKGFKIPKWNQIVTTCCEAAKLTTNPITGWDVVLNNRYEVEFVEANYGPDMDMMQTRYKKGAKRKLYTLINEYCGIDMK